ncbi:MAG: pantoate--beta-alanine ligase, partial [candidate division Zixibacteria bacterium]|nr:pantoate--beta-alanine ligase [candidate division Zixibacteria bacterium]
VKIEKEMRELIYATCKSAKIDYIAFTDLKSLKPSKKIIKSTICSLAVKVHKVRLIDNMRIS